MSADFLQTQRQFTAHLRNPTENPGPADVEDRRMAIYRDLIYNNIEGFLDSGFPILREIHSDAEWQALVREFIVQHQCHSPYFLEISQEFLKFLQQRSLDANKPFLVELAHYEWVELALDCSTEVFPEDVAIEGDLLEMHPVVSPLVWNLSYQYPVHQISSTNQPIETPSAPTFLVVYRNRHDKVGFMESNAATSRLITILSGQSLSEELSDEVQEGDALISGRAALEQLAQELKSPDQLAIINFGADLIKNLLSLDIICGFQPVVSSQSN